MATSAHFMLGAADKHGRCAERLIIVSNFDRECRWHARVDVGSHFASGNEERNRMIYSGKSAT